MNNTIKRRENGDFEVEYPQRQLSYGDYMKLGLKIDRLQQESLQIEQIIKQLNENNAHRVTGVVYDFNTLANNKKRIDAEIQHLNSVMDDNK